MKKLALILALLALPAHAAILLTLNAGPYRAQLTQVKDPDSTPEQDCYTYATLTVWKQNEEEGGSTLAGQHKLCGADGLSVFTATSGTTQNVVFVVDRPGDGKANAGLYRYDPATNQLQFHNFNARHVVVDGLDGTTLKLRTQNRNGYTTRAEGLKPDTLATYLWPAGQEPQIQPK